MRITGGEHRGRILAVPAGQDVRPTTDKVRQAIFNMLLQYGLPEGAQVLDMFCGTGALGLEALSRGAEFCTFMDTGQKALDCAGRNIDTLKAAPRCRVMRQDATRLGQRPLNHIPATLAFLDPPYRKSLVLPALMAAVNHGWLAAGALCVIEAEKDTDVFVPEVFTLARRKLYGDTQIVLCVYGPQGTTLT